MGDWGGKTRSQADALDGSHAKEAVGSLPPPQPLYSQRHPGTPLQSVHWTRLNTPFDLGRVQFYFFFRMGAPWGASAKGPHDRSMVQFVLLSLPLPPPLPLYPSL